MQLNNLNGWNTLDFSNGRDLIIQRKNDHSLRESGIKLTGLFSSNAINIPFALAVFRDDFIDDEKKIEVTNRLRSVNAFELSSSAELFYRFEKNNFLFNTPALITLNFKAGSINEAKFTKDLFQIIFFGNASYAGATADFSQTENLSYRFHQLRLGVQKKFDFINHNWEAGIGISVLAAKSGSSLKIDQGTLFTEQYGSFIDASYNFEYSVSDTLNKGYFAYDGIGTSADATLSYIPDNGSLRLLFFMNDMGFIRWNRQSQLYSADSSLHFEGFEVIDLFNSSDSALLPFNKDSLLHLTGTKISSKSFSTLLPVKFSLAGIY
ncbi:MAG: hypothetical protein H0V65_08010, partial [Chitinophagales bacterium]|nr:hypothetical protein [Chitinophagales bacterium]